MKILLPVDGSACSQKAVDWAIAQGGQGLEIHLLNVHPPLPIGRVQAHIDPATLQAYYRETGDEALHPAETALQNAGQAYTRHLHVGLVPEVIARMAAELAVDMVVMGSHGRGQIAGLVMGSVAQKTVHLASCPVLLVK